MMKSHNALKTMIKFVTVRSSQINSGRSTSTTGADLITAEDKYIHLEFDPLF